MFTVVALDPKMKRRCTLGPNDKPKRVRLNRVGGFGGNVVGIGNPEINKHYKSEQAEQKVSTSSRLKIKVEPKQSVPEKSSKIKNQKITQNAGNVMEDVSTNMKCKENLCYSEKAEKKSLVESINSLKLSNELVNLKSNDVPSEVAGRKLS